MCPGENAIGLHEEGPQRELEGGDGTAGSGKGGLQMGDDVSGGAVLGGQ